MTSTRNRTDDRHPLTASTMDDSSFDFGTGDIISIRPRIAPRRSALPAIAFGIAAAFAVATAVFIGTNLPTSLASESNPAAESQYERSIDRAIGND